MNMSLPPPPSLHSACDRPSPHPSPSLLDRGSSPRCVLRPAPASHQVLHAGALGSTSGTLWHPPGPTAWSGLPTLLRPLWHPSSPPISQHFPPAWTLAHLPALPHPILLPTPGLQMLDPLRLHPPPVVDILRAASLRPQNGSVPIIPPTASCTPPSHHHHNAIKSLFMELC